MNKLELTCVNCGNVSVIETFSVFEEPEFCPICGVSKYDFDGEDPIDDLDDEFE